jgi:predicted ATPase/transcriptional regulator with XRE-family HTH domain
MNRAPLSFGQWLKQRRKALDLTQEDLALRIDCSLSSIEKIESGERRPSRQVADLVADCLGIPADERQAFIAFARSEPQTGTPVAGDFPELAPWRSAHRRRNNLPVPLTRLIGREREMEAVSGLLLRERARLVTLVGPPGIGKTRLALEVAAGATDDFDDGVYFVPLASVADPGLVLPAVARALGVPEVSGQPLAEGLAERLGDKRALLVLDNFEHVVAAAPQVAALLTACPWLKVLVTGREALRVRGERRFNVPPLEVPDLDGAPGISALLGCSSVALFVERAQEANPDFEITEESAGVVAALCAHLEGVPLAIELVAARRQVLSHEAALRSLEQQLTLPNDLQDVPARHRTLRDATRWSYDLLDSGEQRLFARLGVFAGGCTRSAAEAVCNARGDLPLSVSKGLASLSDKSLLSEQRPGGGSGWMRDEPRYDMLQIIHEYALERLRESGEEEAIRRLHAEHYLALAEAAESALEGPQQAELMDWLDNEHDNLQAALGWVTAGGDSHLALQLAAALAQFWGARGYLTEGRKWLETALSLPVSGEATQHAKALLGAGSLAARQGDYPHAMSMYERGLAIYRGCGEERGMALALVRLGAAANEQGDFEAADVYYRESLALFRALDDKVNIAGILNNLGNQEIIRGNVEDASALYSESLRMARELGNKLKVTVALLNLGRLALYHRADFEAATAYLEESLALYRELGSKGGIAATLYQLGQAMLYQGAYSRAQGYFEESLALCEQLSEWPGIGATRLGLGLVALLQGGYGQARTLLTGTMALYRDLQMRYGITENLEALAGLAAVDGDPQHAARLFGAAEALREQWSLRTSPVHAALLAPWVEQARSRLDPDTFEAAWSAGRAMSTDEAVQFALRADEIALQE